MTKRTEERNFQKQGQGQGNAKIIPSSTSLPGFKLQPGSGSKTEAGEILHHLSQLEPALSNSAPPPVCSPPDALCRLTSEMHKTDTCEHLQARNLRVSHSQAYFLPWD